MAILFEKNFDDPNENIVRQFTNCCGASDKGTEYGVVCRGCYDNIDEIMGEGDEELFQNYITNDTILGKFNNFLDEVWWNYEEWHNALIEKIMVNRV
jgi:hypothetical protein